MTWHSPPAVVWGVLGVAFVLASGCGPTGEAPAVSDHDPVRIEASTAEPDPVDLLALRAIEAQVVEVTARVRPAVVAVGHTGRESAASGVMISPDGLVLSQFHVTHARRDGSTGPGPHATGTGTWVVFEDGTRHEARLLGATLRHDLSLLRLTHPGPHPFVPLASPGSLRLGQWVLKLGHPGHYQAGRRPVVRLGRVVALTGDALVSDGLINGGDSGGPFFDLEGRLIALVLGATADLARLVPRDNESFDRVGPLLFAANRSGLIAAEMRAMERGQIHAGPTRGYDLPLLQGPRLPAASWTQGEKVRVGFETITRPLGSRVIAILDGDVPVVLGTVVGGRDGQAWAITKASELPARPQARWAGGEAVPMTVLQVREDDDLALVQVPAGDAKVPAWTWGTQPDVGRWVAVPGPAGEVRAVGVVSAERSDAIPTWQQGSPRETSYLPLRARRRPDGGEEVEVVFGRRAFDAGLRAGDGVRLHGPGEADGRTLDEVVSRRGAPDRITLEVSRGDRTFLVDLPLPARGATPGYNRHSGPYPGAFEVAVPLDPAECGAPVVDLEGRLLGIAAARHELQGCRVVPARRVLEWLTALSVPFDFRSGNDPYPEEPVRP